MQLNIPTMEYQLFSDRKSDWLALDAIAKSGRLDEKLNYNAAVIQALW